MLFAIVTEADPRDLPIPKYLETVHRGHEYLQELSAVGKLKQAFVRAGMAGGLWLIEADSLEELNALIQRNPTAPYARYQTIALAVPGSVSFSNTVTIQAPVEFIYALLWEVERWPTLLPHVQRIHLREQAQDYQDFEMEVAHPAGSLISRSIRRGVAGRRIHYEQVEPPPLFRWHSGAWVLDSLGDMVKVTAQHTLELEPAEIAPVLGRDCSLPEARAQVQRLVGYHSLSTLRAIKSLAERQHSILWEGDSA